MPGLSQPHNNTPAQVAQVAPGVFWGDPAIHYYMTIIEPGLMTT